MRCLNKTNYSNLITYCYNMHNNNEVYTELDFIQIDPQTKIYQQCSLYGTNQQQGWTTDDNNKGDVLVLFGTNTTNNINKFYPHRDNFDPLQSNTNINKPQIHVIGIIIDKRNNETVITTIHPSKD